MEYRPGQPLTEALAEAGDEVRRRSLLFEFGRTLAEIHRRTAPPELAHPEPWLEHMLRLAEQYLRGFDVDGDAALLQRLWDERPEPVPPCLIHGDRWTTCSCTTARQRRHRLVLGRSGGPALRPGWPPAASP